MDRAAEEKKWQAQLQLQRDQMARNRRLAPLPLIKEAATHRTKRGRIAAVVAQLWNGAVKSNPSI